LCHADGVVVNVDDQLNAIENQLDRLMVRHIPARIRNQGFVFHATEVFNGGKYIKRDKPSLIGPHEWPMERRQAIANDIIDILKKFKLPIAIGFVERSKFAANMGLPQGIPAAEETIAAHVATFMNCAMVAEQWMRKETQNENCLLVVENNDDAREMIKDVHRYHQDKKIEAVIDDRTKIHFPLRKIKEDPLFQPKKATSPLVLADFCAYIFKKYLMKNQHYQPYLDKFIPNLISFDPEWLERRPGRLSRSVPRSAQR
jgi:hypothetical protein